MDINEKVEEKETSTQEEEKSFETRQKNSSSLVFGLIWDLAMLVLVGLVFVEATVRMVNEQNHDVFFIIAGVVSIIGIIVHLGPSIANGFASFLPKNRTKNDEPYHRTSIQRTPIIEEFFKDLKNKGDTAKLEKLGKQAKQNLVLNWVFVVVGLVVLGFSSTWNNVDEPFLYFLSLVIAAAVLVKAFLSIKVQKLKISLVDELVKNEEKVA